MKPTITEGCFIDLRRFRPSAIATFMQMAVDSGFAVDDELYNLSPQANYVGVFSGEISWAVYPWVTDDCENITLEFIDFIRNIENETNAHA